MGIFFYIFAFLLITSAVGVVASKNPVYSVLWLIFSFCNASSLFILLGAEFLAFTLVIVYVGAVAVLFLFVVMMLDIDITALKTSIAKNWPVTLFFLTFFLIDLVAIILLGLRSDSAKNITELNHSLGSIFNIGEVLYTKYMLPFQLSGIILLVAMIGCIVLTLRHLTFVKRQDVKAQLSRSKENSLSLAKPKSKTGVKNLEY